MSAATRPCTPSDLTPPGPTLAVPRAAPLPRGPLFTAGLPVSAATPKLVTGHLLDGTPSLMTRECRDRYAEKRWCSKEPELDEDGEPVEGDDDYEGDV